MSSAALQAGHGVDIRYHCKLYILYIYIQYIEPTQSTAFYVHLLGCQHYQTTNLMNLETQHQAGVCIITGCTKSTRIANLTRESNLLSLADQAEIATARLHERALCHCHDTPIAQAARRSVEISQRGNPGRRTRSQAQCPRKSSWHETTEDIARQAGIDTAAVELTTLGPLPWIDICPTSISDSKWKIIS